MKKLLKIRIAWRKERIVQEKGEIVAVGQASVLKINARRIEVMMMMKMTSDVKTIMTARRCLENQIVEVEDARPTMMTKKILQTLYVRVWVNHAEQMLAEREDAVRLLFA